MVQTELCPSRMLAVAWSCSSSVEGLRPPQTCITTSYSSPCSLSGTAKQKQSTSKKGVALGSGDDHSTNWAATSPGGHSPPSPKQGEQRRSDNCNRFQLQHLESNYHQAAHCTLRPLRTQETTWNSRVAANSHIV